MFRVIEMQLLDITAKISSIAANAAIVVTLGVGWSTYLDQIENKKIEASLDLVRDFNNETHLSSRRALYEFWAQYDLSKMPENTVTYSFLSELLVKWGQERPKQSPSLDMEILVITDFFERVENCIQEEVCNKKIVLSQLGGYGHQFYCIYSHELKRIGGRLRRPDFASNLAVFAKRLGAC
ncbi:MAG: hypothetical protein C0606_17215 [Hyphomicrobiales bacterium]|nr:MAG: hypothetical protein C0606_17215 [Hyphomicrobiales bacterium]